MNGCEKEMFEKYLFVGTNEYKASIKQVGGSLQINDVSVSAKTRSQLRQRLKDTLTDVLDVLDELNKEIDTEATKKKKKEVKEKAKADKNKTNALQD